MGRKKKASPELPENMAEFLAAFGNKRKERKYRNAPVEVDGRRFASKAEARRYGQLKLLLNAGKIRLLEMQVPYTLTVNEQVICKYVADFVYEEWDGSAWVSVVEDVKGMRTKEYILKRKLMLAIYGIAIREVQA